MNNGGAVNITEDQKERMRVWDIFRLYGFVLALMLMPISYWLTFLFMIFNGFGIYLALTDD